MISHDDKTQKAQRARKIRNSTSVSFNYTVLAHQFGGKSFLQAKVAAKQSSLVLLDVGRIQGIYIQGP